MSVMVLVENFNSMTIKVKTPNMFEWILPHCSRQLRSIVARSQKEIKNQLTPRDQQEPTQPTPTNQGKGELK